MPTHPTRVERRNSKSALVALPSHKYCTDGALGLSHLQASPISFHSLLVCGRHAGHLVNRWCLNWGSLLVHHQHSGVSVRSKLKWWVPISVWPDSSR